MERVYSGSAVLGAGVSDHFARWERRTPEAEGAGIHII